ncbi:hypothetical protein [uncultured Kordia sp.]|uniref:hypothetical protein n=1 Tax=uncultured Kordia sp. TaxID=507699 RepID=UPI00261FD235|nr:hypothetical protein [uncultured Kordia sp.]
MGDKDLTLKEINDLIELTKLEIEKMKEHRAQAYAHHDKNLKKEDYNTMKIDEQYFGNRAKQLDTKLSNLVKDKQELMNRDKDFSKKNENKRDNEKERSQ